MDKEVIKRLMKNKCENALGYGLVVRLDDVLNIIDKACEGKQPTSVPQANELLPHVSKPKGTVCPSCENPYPHLLTNGTYNCEECGCTWRAN